MLAIQLNIFPETSDHFFTIVTRLKTLGGPVEDFKIGIN